MEKFYTYRLAPQARFRLTKDKNKQKFSLIMKTYSQKCLKTQGDQKILFRTKNNILVQNPVNCQNSNISKTSKKKMQIKRQMSQRAINTTDKKYVNMKFHQVTFDSLQWQKWKHPESIIVTNRRLLSQRSEKRAFTYTDQRKNEEIEVQEIIRQTQQKEIERKLHELKRFKKMIQQKKQVISVMNDLYEKQNLSIKRTFNSMREEMERTCDFYAKYKFEQLPLKRLLRPNVNVNDK